MKRALLTTLFACSGLGCHGLPCGSGTVERDGQCISEALADPAQPTGERPTMDDVLGPCRPAEANGRLDLVHACLDGGCLGDTLDELTAAWGEPTCEVTDDPYQKCTFANGQWIWVDDEGGGGIYYMVLDASTEGQPATERGAGLGSSLACLIEELPPTTVGIAPVGRGSVEAYARWETSERYLYAYTEGGVVTYIMMYGFL